LGTGTAIGSGNANTNAIIVVQRAGNYAAQLCADLVLGGYNDWYLPSSDELNKLYFNKNTIGGFSLVRYGSSSQYAGNMAYDQNFSGGAINGDLSS
jgi:hypothetical protein